MSKIIKVLFTINLMITCTLHAQVKDITTFLPAQIQEFDWNSNTWVKLSDKDLQYYQDGKIRHYDKYTYNQDGSETKESVDYDTLTRVTSLFSSIKSDGANTFINNVRGLNCFTDYFNSCGNSGERWDRSSGKWVVQYGRKSEPVISSGNITGLIWSNWDNNFQNWIPAEKEEYHFDIDQKLIGKTNSSWDQVSSTWNIVSRLLNIEQIPGRPTLFSSYLKQIYNSNMWTDSERYMLQTEGKTAFKDLTEKYENNTWIPVTRNQLFPNGDFYFDRYVNSKWITIETLTQYVLLDHHQRYTVSSSGDTLISHYHKRWYDDSKNTLHYIDFTNSGGSISYYEESNDITYNTEGHLDFYIQNSRSSEKEAYQKKKKYVYSNYIDVTTGIESEKNTSEASLIEIYPNPSSNGIFKIKSTGLVTSRFTIHNLQGELLTDDNSKENIMNLEKLPDGIYICTMGTSKTMISIIK